jgi:hypothetical protein
MTPTTADDSSLDLSKSEQRNIELQTQIMRQASRAIGAVRKRNKDQVALSRRER